MGKQEKLRIPLDVPGVESEEVGVELLAEGYYLVATLPAVAQDCALGDVVRAHHVDEVLEFQEVAVAGRDVWFRGVLFSSPAWWPGSGSAWR